MDIEEYKRNLKAKMYIYEIPAHMHEGLASWIVDGTSVGDFLTAILSNDLKGACARADAMNRIAIFNYVNFLWNCAPSTCWGSPERLAQWKGIERNPIEVVKE